MKKIVVESNAAIRLDKYLTNIIGETRSTILKMIAADFILVNGIKAKPSYQVKINDLIEIKDDFIIQTEITPEKIDLDIIYEDEYLIIVNKPSGLVVHPGSGNASHTLVNALMHHTKNLSDVLGENRLGIVHRIDKDTSGLLIVAKNNKVHNLLADSFKNKTIKREYIALLCGNFPHESATIDAPIGRDKIKRKQMTVTNDGKKAITHLKVLKRFKEYTLVSCILETGRTHQIRVHMKYIGYPIYNDPVYGNKSIGEFGQFLHSGAIEFKHPITNESMCFKAPLPKKFQDFIDILKD